MKLHFIIAIALTVFACNSSVNVETNVETSDERVNRQLYQLKIYSFKNSEQANLTDSFLSGSYLPAMKKLGISNIGVFKTRDDEVDSLSKTYVLMPFKSLDDFLKLDTKLLNDDVFLQSGKEYLNASHTNPPYNRIQSVLLRAFEDMPIMELPKLSGPKSERIYELRSYESATEALYRNKVEMFNAGGEIKIFSKLDFNAVFYAEVLSGANMPNLMYMTTFENMDARDAHWKNFVDSEDWKTLKVEPQYQNNVSHADIMLLKPAEYSDY